MDPTKVIEAEKVQMDTAFSELTKNFQSNVTRPLQWRKETLEHLRKVIKESEASIIESLKKDLNLGEMNAYLCGVGIPVMLIDHVLSNLSEW